jgi:hypothetical protein
MRRCSTCGQKMLEGYTIAGGMEYYCSDDCLITEMTLEEYLVLYRNGEGDSYWTDWKDEGDW